MKDRESQGATHVTASVHPGAPSYSFDNDDPESVDRHRYLSAILDGSTFARLSTLGDLTGRRCLEVGAGGGSVARWMADRVGPTGHVLATDLNPRHIPGHPGYSTMRHDLVTDPVPDAPWDVIHARMVLIHIPERRDILIRLAGALAPGGALVIEDWATQFGSIVLAAPTRADADLVDAYHDTMLSILPGRGNDPMWATQVHSLMLAAGLSGVDTHIDARSWRGGTAAALLISANVAQLRPEFLAAGFTHADIDRLARLVTDPRLVLRSHFMYSTIGRRPRA
jgi:SAM-dependent methyltransferase